MFKNVLVGVDGSPNGRDAIALATQLRDPDGRLTLAHVHRGELADELEDSHKLLEHERTDTGVEPQLISRVAASPGRGLHEQAEEQDADLLVVGSCRHGLFGRAMLGDDTRAALNGAPCAVAVATRGYAERRTPITKIGVAYNGSAESTAVLELARQAAPTAATVHALEVVSLPLGAYGGMVPPVGEYIDGMLKEANGRLQELSGVDARAVYGIPGEELAAFGDVVDILVVGSRGYGPVRRLVVGSTSNYLERHARCCLLVLPRMVGTAGAPGDSKRGAEMPAAAI
jgi:nucleotide-binding universal stress UspA family protein